MSDFYSEFVGDAYNEPVTTREPIANIEVLLEGVFGGASEEPVISQATEPIDSPVPSIKRPGTSITTTSQTDGQDSGSVPMSSPLPLDKMGIPDYLGGFLPTPEGCLKYMEQRMREAQKAQETLKCPHCQRVLGNAGSHKRHVTACRQRPEKVAEMVVKSTCGNCGRVLKTSQAMLGHQRHCVSK